MRCYEVTSGTLRRPSHVGVDADLAFASDRMAQSRQHCGLGFSIDADFEIENGVAAPDPFPGLRLDLRRIAPVEVREIVDFFPQRSAESRPSGKASPVTS